MTKFEMAKAAGQLVVSIGVGAIVSNVVKATMPVGTNPIIKVCVAIGGLVLADAAGNLAVAYTDKKMDETFEDIKAIMAN